MKETFKMKRNSKHFTLYSSLLSLLLLVAVTMRTVACFTELDYNSGYYGKELFISISAYVIVAAAVIAVSYVFITEKRTPAPRSFGAVSYVPAGAVSAALLFLAAELLRKSKGIFSGGFSPSRLLGMLSAIFALLSILCFFFDVYYDKRENQKKAYFGMAAALFFALFAVYLYFDKSLPINAPNKITEQMAYLFAALFFVYETRNALGRSLWRLYTASGLIAALLTAYNSIPALILYFAKGELICDSIASALLTLLVSIFIAVRIVLTETTASDEKCSAACTVLDMTEQRLEQIKGEFAIARENNNEENSQEEIENYSIQIPEPSETNEDDGAVNEENEI